MAIDLIPLSKINSDSRFVLYSEEEGLISSHEKPTESLKALCSHLSKSSRWDARVYERTPEGWAAIL